MMNEFFSICGVPICLRSQQPLAPLERERLLFRTEERQAGITVELNDLPHIARPIGVACTAPDEIPTWQCGDRICRGSHDTFRPHMHMRADYAVDDVSRVTCLVRREYWPWATRGKYLWPGIMLHYLLLRYGVLFFHASYVAHNGAGILFTAPSGTGKSTQACLWQQLRGARIVNGDKAAVRVGETVTVHGVPFSGTSGICENVSLPLQAIVVLSQAPENTVTRLSPVQAAQSLFPNLFVDRAISQEWQLALQHALDLVARVPIYALACTPDEGAVIALEKALRGGEQP